MSIFCCALVPSIFPCVYTHRYLIVAASPPQSSLMSIGSKTAATPISNHRVLWLDQALTFLSLIYPTVVPLVMFRDERSEVITK